MILVLLSTKDVHYILKWSLFQLIEFTILYGALASMYRAPIYQKQRYCYLYLYTTTAGLLLAVV